MKISFIMPTYNDSDSILETIDSLVGQTYYNWELIVVDDGSTDDINEIIKPLLAEYPEKIKYIYQDNQDQLNALLNGSQFVSGEYIFILHSDDLLPDSTFLENTVAIIERHPEKQCFTGSLQIIDKNSEVVGLRRLRMYSGKDDACVKFLLHLGRNLISDFAFFRKDFFLNQVKENYLTWNTPYWLPVDDASDVASNFDLKTPILKYRVYDNNYLNSELGILNVLNGELRAAIKIMKWYNIPFFNTQFILFNILNRLGMGNLYKPFYTKREMKSKARYVKYVISMRLAKSNKENEYFNSILDFFKKKSGRELILGSIPESLIIYKGKDMKLFNKRLLSNTLDPFYKQFMEEMRTGFGSIAIMERDIAKIEDILKFFSIYGYVKIRVINV